MIQVFVRREKVIKTTCCVYYCAGMGNKALRYWPDTHRPGQPQHLDSRNNLQKVLRQERIHHAIFGVELAADFTKEIQPATEHLTGIVRRYLTGLIKYGQATPVSREVAKVNREIFPATRLGGNRSQRDHRFIEAG